MAPIKRPHYFHQQFLIEPDFTLETDYHLDMRRRHNLLLHTKGVAGSGLVVSGTVGAGTVSVTAGMALDGLGRDIVLVDPATVPLPTGQTSVDLYIEYTEVQSDPVTAAGVTGNTRWTETPKFTFAPPAAVPANGVLLATIPVNVGGQVTGAVNNAVRMISGSVQGDDLQIKRLFLKVDAAPQGQWPRFTAPAANMALLGSSSLRLDSGNREILFDDQGQIRSFDNAHRIVFNRPGNQLQFHEFGDILFFTGGAGPTEKARLLSTGNFGLGIAAPAARLHLVSAEPQLRVETTGTRSKIEFARTGAVQWDLGLGTGAVGNNDFWIGDFGTHRLVIKKTTGRVGIGLIEPNAQLQLTGGNWDLSATEGDFKIGNDTHRLKIGLATGGGGAGDVRIRSHGGTNRIMLGGGTADVLTVNATNVGVGNIAPTSKFQLKTLTTIDEGPQDAISRWSSFGQNAYFTDGGWQRVDTSKKGVAFHMNANYSEGTEFHFLKMEVNGVAGSIAFIGSQRSFIKANLGLGDDEPAFPLDVKGRMRSRGTGGSNTGGLWFSDNGTVNDGFVGMANNDELGFWGEGFGWALKVNKTNAALVVGGSASKPGGGSWGNSSDRRLKHRITGLKGALDRLLRLRGRVFEWKDPKKQGNLTGPQIGFVADEVEPVFPEWVSRDREGYQMLEIRGMEALTVEALRELALSQQAIRESQEALSERLATLEERASAGAAAI